MQPSPTHPKQGVAQWFPLGLLCIALWSSACAHNVKKPATVSAEPIIHKVSLTHPSVNNGKPVNRMMREYRDTEGEPSEFSLDVRSVICGDEECEVITVRLMWDPLGRYTHCSFPRGGELTKRGHEGFSMEDYAKLKIVLSDKDSSLNSIDPHDVVKPTEGQRSDDNDQVDGITTATLLSDKDEYVEGAIYTSYTLWHWVNREMVGTIRNLASSAISNSRLSKWLLSEDQEENAFALKELSQRKVQSRHIDKAVKKLAAQEGTELTDPILAYYESMGAEKFFTTLENLFKQGSSKQRILYIAALTSSELEVPDGFYDGLSRYLPELESYQEIHMFLSLLSYRNPDSATVIQNTLPLLNNPSFKTARKAYKFLAQQTLTPKQGALVAKFQKRNQYRL